MIHNPGPIICFLFTRDNHHNWAQTAYLKAGNPEGGDYFGEYGDISGDGNTLAIGAVNEKSLATGINGDQNLRDEDAYRVGAVYMY